jgi:UDP-N-acetyl-D-mannosaminuronate dehydrogenase
MKTGILGYGEVGKAIAQFYDMPLIKDLDRDDGLEKCDYLHICIPYTPDFVNIVFKELEMIKPKISIIHSSVAPGTTLALKTLGFDIVHSPVMGVHPDIYKGIQTFVKYIGNDDRWDGIRVSNHFSDLGIKTHCVYPSRISELAKLLDTTYYGLCIAWHGEVQKICEKEKLPFDEIFTLWNTNYNVGYKELGKHNVIRPVLYPPPENKIGGHCVIPNAEILDNIYTSKAIDLILEYK